jgi:WD40 repeat protein
MSVEASTPSPQEQHLHEVIAAYLAAAEGGQNPDRAAWLQAHPDLADDLRAFFADHDRMRSAVGRPAAVDAGPDRVRYFGDYELLAEIGRGGMGVVYQARQVSLNRTVALKMILAGQMATAEDVRRFRAEAAAAANLDHPHIVPIYEVGDHDGRHYFSMKLMPGSSLSVQAPGLITNPRAVAQLLVTLARAIHHAHQRGIIHRDLKPSNILIDDKGQPHVADFGFARRLDDGQQSASGSIAGTASYMAPEQALGSKQLTTAVDVYGLGAILYELLAGQPPFQGATLLETHKQVIERDPVKPRSLNPKVNRDLETVCLKCLNKDPTKRYGTALALAEDVERWLRGEPIQARPASVVERTVKWARRRPAAAALVVVSAAALLCLAASGWYFTDQLRDQRDRADVQRDLAEQRLDHSRNLLYTMQLRRVSDMWEQDPVRALRLLDDAEICPPALRDFTWELFHRLCQRERLTLQGHKGEVISLAISQHGKTLVSASTDYTVRVWDLPGGKLRHVLQVKTNNLRVALAPDGQTLASFSGWQESGAFEPLEELKLKLWDATTGQERPLARDLSDQVRSFAFSPNGKIVATGRPDGTVKLWEWATGKELRTLKPHAKPVTALAFSPDGKILASGSSWHDPKIAEAFAEILGEVKLHDLDGGTERTWLRPRGLGIASLVFSPDGQALAFVPVIGGAEVRQVATGQLKQSFDEPLDPRDFGQDYAVAFSPRGDLVAVSRPGLIRLWSATTGKKLFTLRQGGFVRDVAFLPDGRTLATCSSSWNEEVNRFEGEGGLIRFWNVAAVEERVIYPGTLSDPGFLGRTNVALTADGKTLAVATKYSKRNRYRVQIALSDVVTGKCRKLWEITEDSCVGLAFSWDGAVLASAHGQRVRLWDVVGQKELATLKLADRSIGSGPLVFSPDNQRLLTGVMVSHEETIPPQPTLTREIRMWDVAARKDLGILTMPGENGQVCPVVAENGLAFTPDGKALVAAHFYGVVVLDATTSQVRLLIREEFGDPVKAAITADGKVLAVANNKRFKLWDVSTGKERPSPTAQDYAGCLAFSPDGKTLAGEGRGSVKLCNVATGQEQAVLKGHFGRMASLAFAADGKSLTALYEDGTVVVWGAN